MNWATILTPMALDALLSDGRPGNRQWWYDRTLTELHGELAGAFDCNRMEHYVIARSLIAARVAAGALSG